jgi:hypothetical protein
MAYSRFFTEAVSTRQVWRPANGRPSFNTIALLLVGSPLLARLIGQPLSSYSYRFCAVLLSGFAVPPLRGPDEIAHFLRIHSYAQGHLIPPASVADRKGIFVNHDLYRDLAFFKAAGEWFAQSRQDGLRYGQIMQMHQPRSGTARGEISKEAVFMPFAGSEGYSPAAYIPYIVGEKIAGWLRLEFPSRLILPRNSEAATGSGGGGEAHIVAKVLYTLGESGSDAGLVAFDEIVRAEVLVERAILQHVVGSCQQ